MRDHHDKVAALEAYPVTEGLRLWWFGGPSYAIKSAESIVYIDPYHSGPREDNAHGFIRAIDNYLLPEDIHRADLVLSTHDHSDHCDPATLEPIAAQTDALFAFAPSSAALIGGARMPSDRIRAMTPGTVLIHRDIRLTAYPCQDWSDPGAVTFVLEAAGETVFIGGDTLFFEGLAEIGKTHHIDLAVMALAHNRRDLIDAELYLDPQSFAKAALALGARRTLPIHWDIWRAWVEDPHLVAPHLEGTGIELVLLEQGESLEV